MATSSPSPATEVTPSGWTTNRRQVTLFRPDASVQTTLNRRCYSRGGCLVDFPCELKPELKGRYVILVFRTLLRLGLFPLREDCWLESFNSRIMNQARSNSLSRAVFPCPPAVVSPGWRREVSFVEIARREAESHFVLFEVCFLVWIVAQGFQSGQSCRWIGVLRIAVINL